MNYLVSHAWCLQVLLFFRSLVMAKTQKGKKKVHVPGHTRTVKGKKVKVPEHYRSTPN
ncbi:hypothetical protein [Neptuniibacter marinus]|uniref:hypothetical protein n=1 Tax=Neptuniibacter marinus TaxID=1806670 RepID=UPI0018D3821D|nr:hypothetical protein [Neptuniibacter marinus]